MNKQTTSAMEITRLLQAWPDDGKSNLDSLLPTIYAEIRAIAARLFAQEPAGHTWGSTALVNEFYLSLTDGITIEWKSRQQFFAFAANKMRRLLINKAHERRAAKRGGGVQPVTLTNLASLDPHFDMRVDLLDLDIALQRLAAEDKSVAQIVELRFFTGLSVAEVAELLELTERTVFRQWAWARAWLHKQLADSGESADQ